MQEYVRTSQADFVMPPRPARPVADSRIVTPPTALPASPYALTSLCHDEIRQPQSRPQFPSIQPPFDTCVSYGPATATLHIRHLSDTNRVFSATRVSNSPICVSTPTRPALPPPTTTKSAKHGPHPGIHPMQPVCQLRPRYDHETNETPLRYEEKRYSYEERLTPLSGVRLSTTQSPAHTPRQLLRNTAGKQRFSSCSPSQQTSPFHAPCARFHEGPVWHHTSTKMKNTQLGRGLTNHINGGLPWLHPTSDS